MRERQEGDDYDLESGRPKRRERARERPTSVSLAGLLGSQRDEYRVDTWGLTKTGGEMLLSV